VRSVWFTREEKHKTPGKKNTKRTPPCKADKQVPEISLSV
jgi:hypothetical protein